MAARRSNEHFQPLRFHVLREAIPHEWWPILSDDASEFSVEMYDFQNMTR